jgi:hypothetical protein
VAVVEMMRIHIMEARANKIQLNGKNSTLIITVVGSNESVSYVDDVVNISLGIYYGASLLDNIYRMLKLSFNLKSTFLSLKNRVFYMLRLDTVKPDQKGLLIAHFSPLRYMIYCNSSIGGRTLSIVDSRASGDKVIGTVNLDREKINEWLMLIDRNRV